MLSNAHLVGKELPLTSNTQLSRYYPGPSIPELMFVSEERFAPESRSCTYSEGGHMPLSRAAKRLAACRHLRVKLARSFRMVPFKRRVMAVLSTVPP